MSKFKANIVIVILVIVLGFIVFNIIGELRENKVSNNKKNEIITEAVENTKDMDIIKIQELETKIHKVNKLLVLEGTCVANVTYSDNDFNEEDTPNFIWIKKKFSEWESRELKVSASYKFGFSYNMENIRIERVNNDIVVKLSKNDLSVEYLELEHLNSTYTESIGWLSEGDFTSQELNLLQERTKVFTFNSIQSNTKDRESAIQNVKSNIEDMADKLGIKVICEWNTEDVVENKDAEIIHN